MEQIAFWDENLKSFSLSLLSVFNSPLKMLPLWVFLEVETDGKFLFSLEAVIGKANSKMYKTKKGKEKTLSVFQGGSKYYGACCGKIHSHLLTDISKSGDCAK